MRKRPSGWPQLTLGGSELLQVMQSANSERYWNTFQLEAGYTAEFPHGNRFYTRVYLMELERWGLLDRKLEYLSDERRAAYESEHPESSQRHFPPGTRFWYRLSHEGRKFKAKEPAKSKWQELVERLLPTPPVGLPGMR